ncbi:MAG: LysM peptidoglycan-binding domain-containing protein [Clostridia bacterium]|nr:LysM peptidoglycan-binding domain-containing protein [Clostridia bacterium]
MESNSSTGRVCPRGASFYTWQMGDSAQGVAQKSGITVQSLTEANEGVDFASLTAGDIICVPPKQLSCVGSDTYVVQAGDTLNKIARAYGTTAAELMKLNPSIVATNLQIGQTLCVPKKDSSSNTCPPNCATCPVGYDAKSVMQGQTFTDLLLANDMSYDAMRKINPAVLPSGPIIGQNYCIPQGGARGYCKTGKQAYQIDEDRTLGEIAAIFNTTQGYLLQLNPTLKPSDFVKGQIICVP